MGEPQMDETVTDHARQFAQGELHIRNHPVEHIAREPVVADQRQTPAHRRRAADDPSLGQRQHDLYPRQRQKKQRYGRGHRVHGGVKIWVFHRASLTGMVRMGKPIWP